MAEHSGRRNVLLEKWGTALLGGFQSVPNVLVKNQGRLELDSVDVVILLHLNLHWWDKDRLPYPSPAMIATRMGVSRRTVERGIFKMEKAGLLKRLRGEGRQGKLRVRRYDLSGLVQKLQEFALVDVNRREYRATQRSRRDDLSDSQGGVREVLALRSGEQEGG